MGKVKIKKADVWIDMTPMSDVMVLLLTFFMLTSTFVKNEAVRVNAPSSVSEIKVPEENVLSILVDKTGKIFLGMETERLFFPVQRCQLAGALFARRRKQLSGVLRDQSFNTILTGLVQRHTVGGVHSEPYPAALTGVGHRHLCETSEKDSLSRLEHFQSALKTLSR